jgi:hypothetical protein
MINTLSQFLNKNVPTTLHRWLLSLNLLLLWLGIWIVWVNWWSSLDGAFVSYYFRSIIFIISIVCK